MHSIQVDGFQVTVTCGHKGHKGEGVRNAMTSNEVAWSFAPIKKVGRKALVYQLFKVTTHRYDELM